MFADYRIRNSSSWTIAIFGLLALMLGFLGLVAPDIVLWQLGFERIEASARASHDYTLIFVMASSMASFNVGAYYILAALRNMKEFYLWTVPFRGLTFTVFTIAVVIGYAPGRFMLVPLWELAGAIATGFALYHERKKGID